MTQEAINALAAGLLEDGGGDPGSGGRLANGQVCEGGNELPGDDHWRGINSLRVACYHEKRRKQIMRTVGQLVRVSPALGCSTLFLGLAVRMPSAIQEHVILPLHVGIPEGVL